MRMKFALAAVLAATATPALAINNWIYVGKNSYGSVYEYDLDTLTRSGSVVTFHLRVRYGPDGPKGEADGYVAIRRANCSDRSYSDIATDYMKDVKVLRTSGAEETRTAPATSIAGEVLKRVCGS